MSSIYILKDCLCHNDTILNLITRQSEIVHRTAKAVTNGYFLYAYFLSTDHTHVPDCMFCKAFCSFCQSTFDSPDYISGVLAKKRVVSACQIRNSILSR